MEKKNSVHKKKEKTEVYTETRTREFLHTNRCTYTAKPPKPTDRIAPLNILYSDSLSGRSQPHL